MVYSPRPPCGTGYPSCGVVVFQLCVRAREEGEPVAPPLPVGQDGFPFCHTHTHTHIRTHTHTHHVFVRYGHSISQPPPCGTGWFPFCHTHTHTHHVFVNVWPFYLPTPLLWNRMVFPFALRHIHTHTHTPVLFSIASLLWKLRLSQGASRAGQAGYDTGAARL